MIDSSNTVAPYSQSAAGGSREERASLSHCVPRLRRATRESAHNAPLVAEGILPPESTPFLFDSQT
jgi:hypothetical protein